VSVRPPANHRVSIAEDIRRAGTLPGWAYGDADLHAVLLERAFAPARQPLPPDAAGVERGHAVPFTFLPGSLDVPLVATRSVAGDLSVLSNACTHRGHLVVGEPCAATALRCRYHGRTFGCDGRLMNAPGFEDAKDFPRPEDDLPRLATVGWGPLLFVALPGAPAFPGPWAQALARLAHVPVDGAVFDAARSKDYEVKASWMAYVDNYLEGFHIPFVHKSLSAVLDWDAYRTEVLPSAVLQVGIARTGEPTFDVADPISGGAYAAAAYYLWLWPNLMLNLYPWGLSLNVVEPLGPARTRIRFRIYVRNPALLEQGAGAGLDQVEHEDESVVESVQLGVRSPLYDRGRYAPRHEQGVHAFHRLLASALGPDL
jgi:choline monooxygenase